MILLMNIFNFELCHYSCSVFLETTLILHIYATFKASASEPT